MQLDFADEEILAYYITLLKSMSMRLDVDTVRFFFVGRARPDGSSWSSWSSSSSMLLSTLEALACAAQRASHPSPHSAAPARDSRPSAAYCGEEEGREEDEEEEEEEKAKGVPEWAEGKAPRRRAMVVPSRHMLNYSTGGFVETET